MINIYTIFEARWLAAGHALEKDGYTFEDFEDMKLDAMGGCGCCQATLAAGNAYPDRKTGFWACRACVHDPFTTVEEFEAWCITERQAREAELAADIAEQEAFEKADDEIQHQEWKLREKLYPNS